MSLHVGPSQLKTRTDPGGHTYTYEFDLFGRYSKMIGPDSTFKQIQYDDASNTVITFDENQHKREYHSDWAGNLLWVREYTDSVNCYLTQYTYDNLGNMTSATDANGNTTSYSYDPLFGINQVTYPDLTTDTYCYDAVGNLVQRTTLQGVTTFTYDATYRLITTRYPDQSFIAFEYDANGNRTLMSDPSGISEYMYDSRNRMASETRTIGGEPYSVSYAYDAASRVVSTTYPDQSVITYEYDSLNRLISIPGYATFTYTADSLVASTTYGNSTSTAYQYDDLNRLTSIHTQKNDLDLLSMDYSHDSSGNITQLGYARMKDQQWVQSTEIFEYDWLDRLEFAQGDYGALSYSFDPLGNRIALNDLTYTYNNMNELVSISDGTAFAYDDVGNMITRTNDDATWSYTYDKKSQLIQAKRDQHILGEYSYDGDGHRILKTEWIETLQEYQTTIYVYSGSNIIFEKNVSTESCATYIYGPSGRIAKKVDGLTDNYHTDHLGSTRLITDESGNPITEATYKPFGETSAAGDEEPYLYNGKEKDSTGLYYYGARYYAPEIGRFTTRDPLSGDALSPQTLNQYVYCLNSTLKYVDPQGMDCEFVVLPDGTISYELAELYNEMQKALDSMSEEDWNLINDLLSSSKIESKMKAVGIILDKAGIDFVDSGDLLMIEINDKPSGIAWKDIGRHYGITELSVGKTNTDLMGGMIYLNPKKIKEGGDLFMTLGHELVHSYHSAFHWDQIRYSPNPYVYGEYTAYTWSISVIGSVPHVTPSHSRDIATMYWRFRSEWLGIFDQIF
ncbi:MAG: RHS repeat protein [Theionarchaea archaeon]|nr:RHS repeat protein [Theionarchaea archaeon]